MSRAGEAGRSSIPEQVGESYRAGRLEQAPDTGVADIGGCFIVSSPASETIGAAEGITTSSRAQYQRELGNETAHVQIQPNHSIQIG